MPWVKQKNRIIADHGDWIEIDVSTPKYPDAVMKIDRADWEMLQKMQIGKVCAANEYAVIQHNYEVLYIHRLILNKANKIDHINRNGRDNRRSNLRPCTSSQNAINRPSAGVYWHKKAKKWMAQIKHQDKQIYLGLYTDFADAMAARKAAELQYFGEFSPYASN